MEQQSIQLVQKPVIKHLLVEVGRNVTERLTALNIENQVATVDTVKALKELRADLNKELAEFESQRKFIKEGVLNPYNEFETIYKTEVSEKYKTAIDLLKDKIATVEDQIKADKKANVQEYFAELIQSEKIDFLKFENLNLDINLSTSEKKYKEQINEFVERIKDDIALIKTNEFEAEIMVEYKTSLNASKAITTIQTRKEQEREEAERIRIQKINNRKNALIASGMIFDEMTNCYAYDNDIYMTVADLESLEPKAAFQTRLVEHTEAIKDKKDQQYAIEFARLAAEKAAAIQPITVSDVFQTMAEATGAAPAPEVNRSHAQAPATPLPAPTIEGVTANESFTAKFEVSGSRLQLTALGAYMKANNITYKNIQ